METWRQVRPLIMMLSLALALFGLCGLMIILGVGYIEPGSKEDRLLVQCACLMFGGMFSLIITAMIGYEE